ncbi:uncharacterized protein LOC109368291 [Meleagris gallopavo]|uniref:uncharacterized protein LOC109368291 n=1 Tax=Meleagris gallopavo TaxID=9103 RepID=UPI00093AC5B8|nr:uncharacterized protein LOC109368291 [Meleagris gallopavo]
MPAFPMKDTAHNAGGTAPTSSTLHNEINELCVRFMRLCVNTKQEQRAMLRAVMPFSELPAAPGHIQQHPCPPLDKKRKHCSERLQNSGNQTVNFTGKRQDEFIPAAKKRCRDLPVLPASLHTKGLSSSNPNENGKKQAQPSCTQAPSLAAQQHKTQESCKTDSQNKQKFQPESVLQKEAEGQKPSGKHKCKTKHLDVQGRKRSFLAIDDPFDTEDTQDMVALPKKVMKQAEPALHCGSLPTKS